MSNSRRIPVLVVIVLLLVGGGLLDRRGRPASHLSSSTPGPQAAAASAGSSAWYCTGATATPAAKDGGADGNVVVANAGSRALQGTITAYPDSGQPQRRPVTVGPLSRQVVRLADVTPSKYASALVELDGGDAAVELAASGPLGDTVSPCASAASPQWYFAEGVTTKDATETLFLFNPFPDDAVVDLVFGTEDGQVTPQALTGLAVSGGSMAAVNVGDFVQRREQVTAAVTARTGRLVTARLQSFDGTAGRKGMALALGSASAGGLWYLPEGRVGDGLTERYQVYNPSNREAQVQLELALESAQAEPLGLTIPAQGRVTVAANDQPRIPKGVAHAVTVRSLNGVGVVVERDVDAGPPSKRVGVAETPGAQVTARRWVLSAGEADGNFDEYLVVQNPGPATARVSLSVLGDGTPVSNGALSGVQVGAGQRTAVRLGDSLKLAATPVLVSSDQPVVVERDLYRLGGLGTSMSIGVPLRG
ncbi:MAG: DUF5719 family protein [Acidimicrobiales bacterium]